MVAYYKNNSCLRPNLLGYSLKRHLKMTFFEQKLAKTAKLAA